jgi:hypothetical protein
MDGWKKGCPEAMNMAKGQPFSTIDIRLRMACVYLVNSYWLSPLIFLFQ